MYKLPMCRICLIKDVRMHCLVNTQLQEIYELLSGNLLETKDTRPLHACYMCCARLRNCLRLRTACLHSEELFSHLLENDSCEVTPSQDMNIQQTDSVMNMNVEPDIQGELKMDPLPKTDEQLHEEHVGDVQDNNNIIEQGICTLVIKQEDIKSEYGTFEDEELDYSIQSTRSLGNGTLENYVSESYRSISSVDLHDIMSNTVDNEMPSINCNDDRQIATGTKNLKPTDIDHASSSANSGSIKKVREHTGEAIHKCDTCGRCFRRSYDLTVHIRTHTGKKPYKCETCGKRFTRKNHMSDHILRHLIDKLYKCSTCGRNFSQKRDLSQHNRLHTGEQPYNCDICGQCFNHKGSLSEHIRIHTGEKPFKCGTCGKCFSRKSGYWVHVRTHTDEKPYICDTCGKGFSLKYALSVHIRTHTGEKPYKCNICKSRFQSNATLARHVRRFKGKCHHIIKYTG